jgi:uncharacterized protein
MIFCFLFGTIISNFKTSKVKLFNIIPKNQPVTDNQSKKNSRNSNTVLITGGNGLVGRHLASLLSQQGYRVSVLSRYGGKGGTDINIFKWDPVKRYIDPAAPEGTDYVIHLAGAGIGEKRWSEKRKVEILNSRIETALFLREVFKERGIKLKAFISASAVGIYGAATSDKIFREDDPTSEDFLGITCRLWEEAAGLFADEGCRVVKIRTAVVIEKSDPALARLMGPARYGLVVRVGTGRQYFPWIHINDLCNIYLKAIRDQHMQGAYNAVAPGQVTHNEFVRTMAAVMKRPVFLPPLPGSIMKIIFGEMADVILEGSRISPGKIIDAGYRFEFPDLSSALKDVILSLK